SFNDALLPASSPLSLHDALPILHQPQARQRLAFGIPGRGEPGEIAVSKRQDRDVARRLTKIDRLDDVVEARSAGRKQMHRSSVEDRKSTRLNSSHQIISYAVFCL